VNTEGGAIYDVSTGNISVERCGFCKCTTSLRGGAILKQNGHFFLSLLCFEDCAVVGSGNGDEKIGHCTLVDRSSGCLSRSTAWKCGLEHRKYGDTPFAFQYSAPRTEDLNTSFCFGFGTPGTSYRHSTKDPEEIRTISACGSGDLVNEMWESGGSYTRHNTVNCSEHTFLIAFYFTGATVTLTECFYFDLAWDTCFYGVIPTTVNCSAYPAVPGFGVCKLQDLHTEFLEHVSGCRLLPSYAFTRALRQKHRGALFVSLLLIR